MGSDTKELSQSISNLSLSTVAKRRMRTSKEEMIILEHYFSQNRNPNNEQKKEIAKAVQMTEKSVHFCKMKGHHQNKKDNGFKSPEQPHLPKQPQLAQEPSQPQEQQQTQLLFANAVGTYGTGKKDKQLTQLPPISSFTHYRDHPVGLDISYYFHHNAFGIEDSMRQWSDYHHDHQAHY
ncbi:Homeodomain-like DNA binding domain-containing transcription factor [Mucor lusitanicus]